MIPRRFPRHAQRLLGGYAQSAGSPPSEHDTVALNISEDGCTLLTGDRLEPVRTRITLCLQLPSNHRVELIAEIIWSKPPQVSPAGTLIVPGMMGVQYTGELPVEYRALLAGLGAGSDGP